MLTLVTVVFPQDVQLCCKYKSTEVPSLSAKNMANKMYFCQVTLDSKEIELPELEGVVVLNITSWGGGCRPWGSGLQGEGFTDPR